MAKICPITKEPVLYLNCLECEDQKCIDISADTPDSPIFPKKERKTFTCGEEMYSLLLDGVDLYSAEKEMYVFLYNDRGGIAYYNIDRDEAEKLEKESLGEFWAGLLGPGGHICDAKEDKDFPPAPGCSAVDFCDENFSGEWIVL